MNHNTAQAIGKRIMYRTMSGYKHGRIVAERQGVYLVRVDLFDHRDEVGILARVSPCDIMRVYNN